MKYTLITGASSGIGKAFAQHYAQKDHNLVLIARSEDKLQLMKQELESKFRINVLPLAYDLSIPDIAQKIYTKLSDQNIEVETLVNSAGIATNGLVSDTLYESQHNQIMLNIVALFDLTKLFLNSMIANNTGTVINVASTSAYHPIPTMAVYAASKAFVLSFSEALSTETEGTNVQIFAISPGATDTNFFSNGGVSYGNLRTPEHVVDVTMSALNKKKISKIDGLNNYFTSMILPRILTRNRMVKIVYNIMMKQK
ncbi:SDR family oxidoreductase [Leuconostoc citreum]|uniref:SDR family NAD(P)-dependent oxidoreductase n=1 Tax=Leuconostoc citreum TaxID=33964 RepID=UPI0021A3FE17|nr:SDR family oxidoreductase [Leuconostoc citreum]MCT3054771.1 SDR family oxidoreductase [Leuconostoc citreum]MCT3063280.1 SDR family oxidoreductase [Leuconostoc citreum]